MSKRAILMFTGFILIAGCATHSTPQAAGGERITVTITSAEVPVVRGYSLPRVPALMKALMRDDFIETSRRLRLESPISVEVALQNATHEYPSSIPPVRSDDPQTTIPWFVVEYKLATPARQTLTGSVLAEGPDPGFFSSIHTHEVAVAKSAIMKVRRDIIRHYASLAAR